MEEGLVLVTSTDGTIVEIIDENEAGDGLELINGILSPGFVNTHCHIELSHMKGLIPQHTGLVDFVQKLMGSRNTAFAEEKEAAMQAAEEELRVSGTVAVGDICNGTDSLLLKRQSTLYWHNFIEVSGFVGDNASQRLDAAEQVLQAFKSTCPQQGNSLAPHAPYSVSKELFRLINIKTAGQVTTIHNQEAAAENELYQKKTGDFLALYENLGIDITGFLPTGKTSLRSWLPYFSGGQQILSVHNSFTSAEEVAEIGGPGQSTGGTALDVNFCICINANLYIENRLPPIDTFIRNKVNIVLGTDSYASNQQLNMMQELQTIQQNFPHVSLSTLLQWATLNGANALGIQDRFGSLDPGKKPGLVSVDEKNFSARLLL